MKIKMLVFAIISLLLLVGVNSWFVKFNKSVQNSTISPLDSESYQLPKGQYQSLQKNVKPLVVDAVVKDSITSKPQPIYKSNTSKSFENLKPRAEVTPRLKKKKTKNNWISTDLIQQTLTTNKDTKASQKSLSSSFDAGGQITNTTNNGGFLFIPADPHGAAGPSHVVNVFNASIEFYNKDSSGGVSSSLKTFFSGLSPANATFDPKVLYDQFANRWVVVTLQKTDSPDPNTSQVFVAVSDDSSPNGTWYMTAINTQLTIDGEDSWFDYPGLAVDEEVIYLTGNMFSFSANTNMGSRLWIIDKTDFYNNLAPVVMGEFNIYANDGFGLTTQPAHVYGATPAGFGTYLVSYSTLSNGIQEFWQYVRVDNPLAAISFTVGQINVGDIEPNGGSGFADAPQAGVSTDTNSSFTLRTNDTRAQDAVWRNNKLYTTATIESNSEPGQASAGWFVFNADTTSSPNVSQIGNVGAENIAVGAFAFFPSIAVNADGGIGLGFAVSSPTTSPGSYYTYRSPTDAVGTMRSVKTLRAGTDFYHRTFGGTNRWGDYSAMVVDPNDECFWVYNKHAVARGASTGTDDDGLYESAFGEVCNATPVVNADSTSVDQGLIVTVLDGGNTSVLTNDTDLDTEDMLSANLVTAPVFASAFSLNVNGTFSYTHDNSTNYTDSFTYEACDDGTPVKCSNATVTISINNTNIPPVAVDDVATIQEDADAMIIDVLSNDTDADGGLIEIIAVTQPANGVVTNNGANVSYKPNLDYCISASVTDDFTYTLNGNDEGLVSVTVTCVDDDPVAVDDTASVDEDNSVNVTVVSNDTDVDGGTISLVTVFNNTNGLATINGDTVDFTPSADFCGIASFEYTINGGDMGFVEVTVNCIDDLPVVVNDTVSGTEDTLSNIDVVANDTDVENDSITLQSVSNAVNGVANINGNTVDFTPSLNFCGQAFFDYSVNGGSSGLVTIEVQCVDDLPIAVNDSATVDEDTLISIDVINNDTDIEGDAISLVNVSGAVNGVVAVNGNLVDFNPALNYCGSAASFNYSINGGSVATVSVSVNCVDDLPVAVDDNIIMFEDQPTLFDVINNDTDIEGDAILIVTIDTVTNGVATIINNKISYTPTANYCGAATLDYSINGGDSGFVDINIICVNDLPIAVDDFVVVDEDSSINILPLTNDTDVENDPITLVSILFANDGAATINGSSIDFTPTENYCGTTTVAYRNNGFNTGIISITVNCIDDLPVAVDDLSTLDEDTIKLINVVPNDTDIENDAITLVSLTQPTHGVTEKFGNSVLYKPTANYCGLDSFEYTINGGDVGAVTITVTCIDDLPVASADDFVTDEDTAIDVDVLLNDIDVDGDPLVISAITQPVNGTTIINGSVVHYAPNLNYCFNGVNSDDFTYTLDAVNFVTVSIIVNCIDDIPLAIDDSKTLLEDSGFISINVLANDTDVEDDFISLISVTDALNGTAVQTLNIIEYQPNSNYCGNDSITYQINGGNTATVNLSITCVDDAPIAVDDNEIIDEDSGIISLNLIANDTDIEGDAINLISVTSPINGTTTLNGNSIDYQPNLDFCGNDSFTYQINGQDTASVNMTIQCVNDQPTFTTNQEIYVGIDKTGNSINEKIACQFGFGAVDEEGSQNVLSMAVVIKNDVNGILNNAVSMDNNGNLSYQLTGNSGSAILGIVMQDSGGVSNNGIDKSVEKTIKINAKDYIFISGMETKSCTQ